MFSRTTIIVPEDVDERITAIQRTQVFPTTKASILAKALVVGLDHFASKGIDGEPALIQSDSESIIEIKALDLAVQILPKNYMAVNAKRHELGLTWVETFGEGLKAWLTDAVRDTK